MRLQSESVFAKLCSVLPGGVNSPVRSFRAVGISPLIAASGAGAILRDVDGHEYIDYCCGWGSLILGHAHPSVVRAAQDQVASGSSFGVSTPYEEQLGAKIKALVPSVEKLRFVSSGTEATMTAARIARRVSGRPLVVKFVGHYHGHSDSLLGAAAETISLPFNDFVAVRSFFRESGLAGKTAALIVEPVAGNMGVVLPLPGFLELLREETARCGALLIFDEVITGFRVALQGAQHLYQIEPDLTCFGKVIGGGFPAAAVGGKAKIMDCLAPLGDVYQAGTLSGNPVAMRAGFETLAIVEQESFYETLEAKSRRLTCPIVEALAGKNGCLQRCGSMFTLFFGAREVHNKTDLNELLFGQFFRFLFERGIFIPPASQEAWFVSSAHTGELLDYTANAVVSFIEQYL